MPAHWLLKTEPGTYSFDRLLKDRKTPWNGVRNFQARNFLRETSPGDLAVIYHSGDDKSAVGIARVVRGAYPDPDPEKPGEWVQIDIEAVEPLDRPVPLSELKATAALRGLLLITHSRLSCMPVTPAHFEVILLLGRSPATVPARARRGPPPKVVTERAERANASGARRYKR